VVPGTVVPATPGVEMKPATPAPAPKVEPKKTSAATVTFNLPADAKLFVDAFEAPAAGAVRTFTTPEGLEAGRDYAYTVRAELVRDGRTLTQTQRVIVRAGEATTVDFANLTPATAAAN
jgi:uncharacterized protein (TIGR03000 family)